MPIDMSKYLGLFTSEALEHLEGLSNELVQLERASGPEHVDAMFRHAHSIKGMAASMGFDVIARLAHRVEDLVDEIRRRPQLMSADIADVLFAAADGMQGMVRAAGEGRAVEPADALLARIGAFLRALAEDGARGPRAEGSRAVEPGTAPLDATTADAAPDGAGASLAAALGRALGAPPASSPAAVAAGAPAGVPAEPGAELGPGLPPRFHVRVRVAPVCPVPGVRGFLVHRKLSAIGNVFDVRPSIEDLRAGRIPGGVLALDVELHPGAGPEAIRRALDVVADLESVEVAPVELRLGPASAAAAPEPEGRRPIGVETSRTVRVRTDILDGFLDSAGELLLSSAQLRAMTRELPEEHQAALLEGIDRLHGIVKDLHNRVMSARMTPLALITDRLPRAARDLSRRRGREADLILTGTDIELDRAILDELSDPLLHLLRNCIDHGIEDSAERAAQGKPPRGRVSLAARRERDRVLLEMEDDGRGMDCERLRALAVERGALTPEAAAAISDGDACLLACLPGVSTATRVTDLSGRGVGMDAVKRAVEAVGGTLVIESTRGRGTRFTLRLPLTVAVVHVLLVGVGDEVFGVPITKVKAVVQADAATLARGRDAPLLPYDGALVPVHRLSDVLDVVGGPSEGIRPHLVLDGEKGAIALEIDRLSGQEEAVLKPLSSPLDLIAGLAGVTILGSGRPIFILDVSRLVA